MQDYNSRTALATQANSLHRHAESAALLPPAEILSPVVISLADIQADINIKPSGCANWRAAET
jgi:hypothetical protein